MQVWMELVDGGSVSVLVSNSWRGAASHRAWPGAGRRAGRAQGGENKSLGPRGPRHPACAPAPRPCRRRRGSPHRRPGNRSPPPPPRRLPSEPRPRTRLPRPPPPPHCRCRRRSVRHGPCGAFRGGWKPCPGASRGSAPCTFRGPRGVANARGQITEEAMSGDARSRHNQSHYLFTGLYRGRRSLGVWFKGLRAPRVFETYAPRSSAGVKSRGRPSTA